MLLFKPFLTFSFGVLTSVCQLQGLSVILMDLDWYFFELWLGSFGKDQWGDGEPGALSG